MACCDVFSASAMQARIIAVEVHRSNFGVWPNNMALVHHALYICHLWGVTQCWIEVASPLFCCSCPINDESVCHALLFDWFGSIEHCHSLCIWHTRLQWVEENLSHDMWSTYLGSLIVIFSNAWYWSVPRKKSSNLITLIWMHGTARSPSQIQPALLPQASSLFNKLVAFPALYCFLLNANSLIKHINLTSNQRVKMRRRTNMSRIMGILTPRFWVGNSWGVGGEFKGQCSLCRLGLMISNILMFLFHRSLSKMLKAQMEFMEPSSIMSVSTQKVLRENTMNWNHITWLYILQSSPSVLIWQIQHEFRNDIVSKENDYPLQSRLYFTVPHGFPWSPHGVLKSS